jgi:hypothetical protein
MKDYHPLKRGFDHFYGFTSGGHNYKAYDLQLPLVRSVDGPCGMDGNDPNMNYYEENGYRSVRYSKNPKPQCKKDSKSFPWIDYGYTYVLPDNQTTLPGCHKHSARFGSAIAIAT